MRQSTAEGGFIFDWFLAVFSRGAFESVCESVREHNSKVAFASIRIKD